MHDFPGALFNPGPANRKTIEEQCDTLLVLTAYRNDYWIGMLRQLPIAQQKQVRCTDSLYQAGPLLPQNLRKPRVSLVALELQNMLLHYNLSRPGDQRRHAAAWHALLDGSRQCSERVGHY